MRFSEMKITIGAVYCWSGRNVAAIRGQPRIDLEAWR